MSNPEEQQAAMIPRNFMERGTFMGGMFKIRNAIEGVVLAAGIAAPVVHLPLSLTTRIILLCMTSLPAAMVSLIGIGGESLTAFLMNALRFLKNRRIIYRSDAMPDYQKRRQRGRNREPKIQKRNKHNGNTAQGNAVQDTAKSKHHDNQTTEGSSSHDSPGEVPENRYSSRKARKKEAARQKTEKKLERRIYDTSTSSGIKKQAKEDIRIFIKEQQVRRTCF